MALYKETSLNTKFHFPLRASSSRVSPGLHGNVNFLTAVSITEQALAQNVNEPSIAVFSPLEIRDYSPRSA